MQKPSERIKASNRSPAAGAKRPPIEPFLRLLARLVARRHLSQNRTEQKGLDKDQK